MWTNALTLPRNSEAYSLEMPAKKQKCECCGKPYWASRSDAKWCSQRCRGRARMEDAKFTIPEIPQSGIRGISFNRVKRTWDVRLLLPGQEPKYIGSFRDLEKAQRWQSEVISSKGGVEQSGSSVGS